jgi:hypothetical protein
MDGKKILLLVFILFTTVIKSQTFTYNYTDPCTGILQSVTLSQTSGTVVMFYAGQYQSFTAAQLQAGGYENWISQINAQFPVGSNPCAGNGSSNANTSNAAIGNNVATSVSGIISITSGMAGSMGGGSINTGSTGSGGSSGDNGSGGSSSGGSTGTSGGSTGGTGGSGGGQSEGGGSGIPGSSQENTETGNTTGGNTESTSPTESGAAGSQENTTTASGGESESSGSSGGNKPKSKQEKLGRGSLIGAGDFVIIRNGNDIRAKNDNLRFNASVTHVNTKQNFIKGWNLNYTTGENILNSTFYGSYKFKGFMGVGSNSTMTNFKSDWFNTTTLLGAQKLGSITLMGGSNFTLGKIGKSDFQNWSIVGGAFSNFKGGKSLSANVMALSIYSPYLFYYEGQWYKSGLLFVPLGNIDFKLTEKFKWSISFSGAYQWQAEILNFQLSTGAKMLL